LNGDKYARKLSEEERKEYFRNKQAEYRAKKKVGKKAAPRNGTPMAGEKSFGDAMNSGDQDGANRIVEQANQDALEARKDRRDASVKPASPAGPTIPPKTAARVILDATESGVNLLLNSQGELTRNGKEPSEELIYWIKAFKPEIVELLTPKV
jgi:hypothetical protein